MAGLNNVRPRWPSARGSALALLAALLFGAVTPLVASFGAGVGARMTAAVLYAGAAIAASALRKRRSGEAPLGRPHLPRLLLSVVMGAVLAPVSFAWALQRTSAMGASLLLNFEVVFTAFFAWLLYREKVSQRVGLALLLLSLGGGATLLDGPLAGKESVEGLLAVLAATAAWALDNSLTRPLAKLDPGSVVSVRAALGASISLTWGIFLGEEVPSGWTLPALLVLGAVGYGISGRFYMLAQREFGAARTASVFGTAPFFGVMTAAALGERPGPWMAIGVAMAVAGCALHFTETHSHRHFHGKLAHEHPHAPEAHHDSLKN